MGGGPQRKQAVVSLAGQSCSRIMSSQMKPLLYCQSSVGRSTAQGGARVWEEKGERPAGGSLHESPQGQVHKADLVRLLDSTVSLLQPPAPLPLLTGIPDPEVGVRRRQRVQLLAQQDVVGRDVGVQQAQLRGVAGVLEHSLDHLEQAEGAGGGEGMSVRAGAVRIV